MKVHDCKQGSPEWHALRLGIPTASEFDALITPEWKIRTGAGPETYLYSKLCEKVLGFAPEAGAWAMEQGVILEQEARPFFEFTRETPVRVVGFCTTDDGRIGCSPDGLIGNNGGIEIKCPQPHTHLRYLLQGTLPKEYAAQVHGSMLVAGRDWWYFMSYSRQFPPLILRVERDERICHQIGNSLEQFLEKFDAALARITAMRDEVNEKKQAEYIANAADQPRAWSAASPNEKSTL